MNLTQAYQLELKRAQEVSTHDDVRGEFIYVFPIMSAGASRIRYALECWWRKPWNCFVQY
jgi:hypothetical protein